MSSHLCTTCKAVMCDDCREIAEEYEYLLKERTRALSAANDKAEKLAKENEMLNQHAALWEDIAKAGIPAVITAWMDKEIEQLLAVHK